MDTTETLESTVKKIASEACNSVYSNVSSVPPMDSPVHRRSRSENVIAGFPRSDSLRKLKSHVQKAWWWCGKSREDGLSSFFNPEDLANQKRLWYQLHSKTMVPSSFSLSYFHHKCFFACIEVRPYA